MRIIPKSNQIWRALAFGMGLIGSVAVAQAALAPLDDKALENISGQAMMEVVTLRDPGTGGDNNDMPMKFMRIRTGAKVEINANIDMLVAGEYQRDDKFTSYSERFQGTQKDYRNPVFHGNQESNVTSARCSNAVATADSKSGCYIPGSDITQTGADVIIENLSLGAVINGQLQNMIMEDPYVEIVFADDNKGDIKKGDIIGLRFGAENQVGHLGNYSAHGLGKFGPCTASNSNACGNLKLTDGQRNRDGGVLSFSGNLNLIAGSTALIGWSLIQGVARTNFTPVKDGLLGGIGALKGNSTQTLADVNHTGTQEFFLSFASRPIQYPNISNTANFSRMKLGIGKLYKTIPGVSINMVDGIALTLPQALHTLSGGVPKFSNCFTGQNGQCTSQ